MHTSKTLAGIEHTETGVRVHLTDGTVEEGDIVIGADGVHSQCQSHMWDYAKRFEPGAIPESDKSALFSEYGGLFGISTPQDSYGLSQSESNIIYGQDHTQLLFSKHTLKEDVRNAH